MPCENIAELWRRGWALKVAAAVVCTSFVPVAAGALSAELFYDHHDPERYYAITAKEIDPPLTGKQLEPGSNVVRLIDLTAGQAVDVDALKGGVELEDGKYDIVHFYGLFNPAREYKVVIAYSATEQKECLVQNSADVVIGSTNQALSDAITDNFEFDLDLFVPEDVQGFGLGYKLKLLSLPWKSLRFELASDGFVKTEKEAENLQSQITGGGYVQLLESYAIPIPVRTPEGEEETLPLKYYYGARLDFVDVETDQYFSIVDYTVKARGLVYVPANVIVLAYYGGLRRLGLIGGYRPARPPYLWAGYTRVFKRDAAEAALVPAPKGRLDVGGKWILPLSDRADVHVRYELAIRLDELETGQERYEEFLDVRMVYYVNAEATAGFDAGYQQGKLPPLYEHASTLFAGFAAAIF